jgi:hypothetical protein
VTATIKSKPAGGVEVTVAGQGSSRSTGANGKVVVDYVQCVEAHRSGATYVETPVPCPASARKAGFAPVAIRLP